MRTTLLAATLIAALAGCQPATPPAAGNTTTATTPSAADAAFAEFSQRVLQQWMALSPVSATQIGDHRYDTRLDDVSAAGIAATAKATQALLDELTAFDTAQLSRENQVDAAILRNQLQGDLFRSQTLADWQWDPQFYAGLAGSAIYSLMAREFAPLPDHLYFLR